MLSKVLPPSGSVGREEHFGPILLPPSVFSGREEQWGHSLDRESCKQLFPAQWSVTR